MQTPEAARRRSRHRRATFSLTTFGVFMPLRGYQRKRKLPGMRFRSAERQPPDSVYGTKPVFVSLSRLKASLCPLSWNK